MMKLGLILVLVASVQAVNLRFKSSKKRGCTAEGSHTRMGSSPEALRAPSEEELKSRDYLSDPELHTVYYLNVDSAADRNNLMQEKFNNTIGNAKLERWAATNKDAALNEDVEHYHWKGGLAGGQWPDRQTGAAIWLSHVKLLQKIANAKTEMLEEADKKGMLDKLTGKAKVPDQPVFVIMEDDVQPVDQFWTKELMCRISNLPADWDIYKFGYMGAPYGSDGSDECQHPINADSCITKELDWRFMGNQGYAVRPQGAANILKMIAEIPAEPYMEIDAALQPGHQTEHKINHYSAKWPLVKNYGLPSTRNTL